MYTYSSEFEWFDANALTNANKMNLSKFIWYLAYTYEIRLQKDGYSKYSFGEEITPTQKEFKMFQNYFKRRDAIGTRFIYVWGGEWTSIFSSGFQLSRLILGPFGYIMGKIPFVAFGWFIFWVCAALFDWVVLGIPYLVLKLASGLPGDYFDSEILLSGFLFGDTRTLKSDLRELIKNDKPNSNAYNAALWGLFMRLKLVEIVRKARNESGSSSDRVG